MFKFMNSLKKSLISMMVFSSVFISVFLLWAVLISLTFLLLESYMFFSIGLSSSLFFMFYFYNFNSFLNLLGILLFIIIYAIYWEVQFPIVLVFIHFPDLLLDLFIYNLFCSLLNFICIIFTLLTYFYMFHYMFYNLTEIKINVISVPYSNNSNFSLPVSSCFSQSPFSSCHSSSNPDDKVFCNVFYPNVSDSVLKESLVFINSNCVNFYCLEKDFKFVQSLCDLAFTIDSKNGASISLVIFSLGSILYMEICKVKGYNFIDMVYFLSYFNEHVLSEFCKNVNGLTFFDSVVFDLSLDLWLSSMDDKGFFKSEFLDSCSDSDKFVKFMNYDITVKKCSPDSTLYKSFPIVDYDVLHSDLLILKSCISKDSSLINVFMKMNNNNLIKTFSITTDSETLSLLSVISPDYDLYLKNCKGKMGF